MTFYAVSETSLSASPSPLTVSQDDIVFDGYSLSNRTTRICTAIDYDNQGKVDLSTFNFPRDDGGGVLTKYYRGRDIKVRITLKESTASAFNTLLDSFKAAIKKTEGYLDIRVNNEIRRIKATATKVEFKKEFYNVTFVNVEVTFTTVEPFFYASNPQSYLFESKTATFSGEVNNAGSGDADPVCYVLFGAGTATSNVSVTAFGRTISVPGSFVPGDVLIIDCNAKSITKNGTEVDYSGMFPIFSPGSCPFQVAFTGTTLADFVLVLAKNYL